MNRRPRVGYQGGAGAYSETAALHHFRRTGAAPRTRGFLSFRSMMEAVAAGEVDCAMLPVENTTAGSITEAYDLLMRTGAAAIGEEILRIEHCLLAQREVPVEHVRRILSHPQALAQCAEFLASLRDCRAEAHADTALAAAQVAKCDDPSVAAIASEEAARLHGLTVIRRDISDQKHNYTRFLVVAREQRRFPPEVPCKTSLVFATRHERGALVRSLAVLADHGLNLTKLESRPRPGHPWQYLFYVDFEGNLADPVVAKALEQLSGRTSHLQVFGSYPVCPEQGEGASAHDRGPTGR